MAKKIKKRSKIEDVTIPIRSVKQFFNDFIVEGLKDKKNIQECDILSIKSKLLDTFRREVFGQLVIKLGPEVIEMSTNDLSDMEGVHNILEQAFRKWRRLCMLCTENGLGQYFRLDDLRESMEMVSKVPDPIAEEDVTGQVPDNIVISPEEGPLSNQPYVNTGYLEVIDESKEPDEHAETTSASYSEMP